MPLTPTGPVVALTNEDLTTGVIGGTGTFDVLMTAMEAHLDSQFQKGRITAENYAKTYIAMTQTAMQGAVQFLLGRDKVFWELINAEAQKLLILEQMEAARAQTMDTRSDGVTTVVGSIGKQKDLYNQQITSYQRDAEVKAAKIFADVWITMKTMDEGLVAPTAFANASIETIMTAIKAANNLD